MWIFTTKGFFSVVENKDDRAKVVIRSRIKQDIENIVAEFERLGLKTTGVVETLDSDYRYRIFADHKDWNRVMSSLTDQITYTNFKNAVYATDSYTVREKRHAAYLDIWSVMSSLQSDTAP